MLAKKHQSEARGGGACTVILSIVHKMRLLCRVRWFVMGRSQCATRGRIPGQPTYMKKRCDLAKHALTLQAGQDFNDVATSYEMLPMGGNWQLLRGSSAG